MLFKKTDTLLQYAELTTVNFVQVKPTIKMVEQQHIIPFIGKELYKTLDDAYTAATDETLADEKLVSLLDMCRSVIGPMVCYYYTPKAEVQLSGSGAQRTESETNKTAYQNQVVNYREQLLREGEMATELLLQFLEDNKTDYATWQSSDAFKDYRSLFIKFGGEFDKLFTSASPYRNYWAMRSKMLDVEQNNIRTIIGDTLFDSLKEKDQDPASYPPPLEGPGEVGGFTDKEKDLLFKIKKVTAYLTVCFSIPFLNVKIDANGISVISINAAQNDALTKKGPAADNMLDVLVKKCEAAATSWTNNLTKYLDDNATDFEGWPLSSPLSTGEGTGVRPEVCNNEDTGSFGLF